MSAPDRRSGPIRAGHRAGLDGPTDGLDGRVDGRIDGRVRAGPAGPDRPGRAGPGRTGPGRDCFGNLAGEKIFEI